MPRFKTRNEQNEEVERYRWPAEYVTPTCDIASALRDWRRDAVKRREEFLGYQKAAGRDDPSGAKFFKECATYFLKLQRACTLMIPWFGEPDANQKPERPLLWPLDLEPELDEIGRRIRFQFG